MQKSQETLEKEIKELIVTALNIEDLKPEDIETEDPLFGSGLGLDSIDALELAFAVSKEYSIKLDRDSEMNAKHFQSVRTLAAMVAGLLETQTQS